MPSAFIANKDSTGKVILVNRNSTPKVASINGLGNGLKFIPADLNYVDIPTRTSTLDFQTSSAFSISAIVYTTISGENFICGAVRGNSFGDGNGDGWSIRFVNSTTVRFIFAQSAGTLAFIDCAIPSTGYNHIILTKSTGNSLSNYTYYLNGKSVTPSGSVGTTGVTMTYANFRIGFSSSSYQVGTPPNYFNGIMYDLKIADAAWNSTDINKLFATDGIYIPSNLIANWGFNEKSGTVLKSTTSDNQGTLTNFVNTSLGASNQWVDKNRNPITS